MSGRNGTERKVQLLGETHKDSRKPCGKEFFDDLESDQEHSIFWAVG